MEGMSTGSPMDTSDEETIDELEVSNFTVHIIACVFYTELALSVNLKVHFITLKVHFNRFG